MKLKSRLDRNVLRAIQALVLGLPLFLGGRQPIAAGVASCTVLALLALTLRERSRRSAPQVPGVGALIAFVALALVTTLPLPPALLRVLSPSTAELYGTVLPGWPGGGGWSTWRSLAIDPYGVWVELGRLSVGLGMFAVVVGYPWGDDNARRAIFARLVLTLFIGGAALAGVGLLDQVAGNGNVLWITDESSAIGRASGPFVNPNHFAAWLEMLIPSALAYTFTLLLRLERRLMRSVDMGRGMGVQRRRAWVAALVLHQQRLWAPLVAATVVLLMGVVHLGTGSRGGTAALLVGLGVAGAGIVSHRLARTESRLRRWLPIAFACVLTIGAAGMIVTWGAASGDEPQSAGADLDVSLASRLAVAAQGTGIVRDHPLFGTGLGSWLHAFRPYVAPPIAGGIWDHAHDDYLELVADSGIAGAAAVLVFALCVAAAIRRSGPAADERALRRRSDGPAGFEKPDWLAALDDVSSLRWGLAGGVAAIMVHSALDFGLRMPANLLLLMLIVGLLVLTGRGQVARPSPALAVLVGLFALAFVPRVANTALGTAGWRPLAPKDCLEKADLILDEDGDSARGDALALLHRALDWSPADRELHEELAEALGPGPEGEQALRRALALEPWAIEVRDELGLRLMARGERAAGGVELEESMYRFPYLVSHAYLSPDLESDAHDPHQIVRALIEGDTLPVRLVSLAADESAAIERGLRRALDDHAMGEERAAIVDDLVSVLEARERWSDAAAVLALEARRSLEGGSNLAHAARNYLKAKDYGEAEKTLLAAMVREPEQGTLYRDLAVEIYAERGDFPMAEDVLEAGERNAVDMLPVYQGVTQVLAAREAARPEIPLDPAPAERVQEQEQEAMP